MHLAGSGQLLAIVVTSVAESRTPWIEWISVGSVNMQEAYDDILGKVLRWLHTKDFQIQLQKCSFGMCEMPFLGWIISTDGLSPDPSNADAIDHISLPTNLTELKSFRSMIGSYTNFVPKLANIVESLHELECKDMPYVWTPACQAAFQEAKASISTHLKLALFAPRCAMHISVDASNVGLGAQLMQEQGGKEVTICCASHTLSEME